MLSRVARNVYWMSRCLERAEDTARLVNVNSHLLMDLPKNTTFGWEPLIAIMGSQDLFYENYKTPDERNVVKFLLGDKNNASSILNSLANARENLRTSRDIIPREASEQVNDLYLYAKSKIPGGIPKNSRYDFLNTVIKGVQQITGLLYGTMSRDVAYDFMRLGRYLERADMTTRILDVRSASLLPKTPEDQIVLTPFDNIQWMSVLKSLTAYQMYRRHMKMVRVRGSSVLAFFFKNAEFPRSVCFCLNQVEGCLKGLPHNDLPLRSLARLQRQVSTADAHALAHAGLHEFIDELQIGMAGVHGHIDTIFFGGRAVENVAA